MKNLSSLRSLSHRGVVAFAIVLIALTATAAGVVQNVTPAPRAATTDNKDTDSISLHLQNADIRDVLKVFGELTGKKMDVASEVSGKIDVDINNIPWETALKQVVSQVCAKARIDGDTIHVTK
jgi:type IV pilus assembly protein PilQ